MYEDVLYETFNKIIALSKMAVGYLDSLQDSKDKTENKSNCVNNFIGDEAKEIPLQHIIHNKNIITRNDGRFEIRDKIDGKTVTTGIARTKNKAIEMHNNKMRKIKVQTTSKVTTTRTLFDWTDEWLEIKKTEIKSTTYKTYKLYFNKHLKPNIKNIDLKKLLPKDIQEMLSKITSERTRSDVYMILNESLTYAWQNKYIKENPCQFIKKPTYTNNFRKALTKIQQQQFLEKVKEISKFPLIYPFYILTGCRPSEIFMIKFKDIKLDENQILINGTKNKYSVRYVPIFKELKTIIDKLPKGKPNEQIFKITIKMLREDFDKIRNELNFDIQIRDLRHTFSTRIYEQGIDPRLRTKLMGHAPNSTINEKVYTDSQKEFEDEQFSKIKNILDQNKNT